MNWVLLLKALNKGQILIHPEKWKTQQVITTALIGAGVPLYQFAVGMGWIPESITEDKVTLILTGLGAVVYALHGIFATVGSTEKIGFSGKLPASTNGVPDTIRTRPIAQLRDQDGKSLRSKLPMQSKKLIDGPFGDTD